MADTDLLIVSRGGVDYKITRGELDAYLNDGYTVVDSMLFNGTNAYLSRTPTVTGNQKTWTWSGWVKRGSLGTFQIVTKGFTDASNYDRIMFFSDNTLRVNSYIAGAPSIELVTNAFFRDSSSWYHIVVAIDTTQATESNRAKLFVNGEQASLSVATYPALNADTNYNDTNLHSIGAEAEYSGTQPFDGYESEVNFIDGQALTTSAFGETGKFGEWLPKKYSGTYGTNGFYLEALDSADLGKDTSGNGNNWTNNNVVQVTDTPTDNYAVINPISNNVGGLTIANGNLSATCTTPRKNVKASLALPNSGKFYWEWTFNETTGDSNICNPSIAPVNSTSDSSLEGSGLFAFWVYTSNVLFVKYNNIEVRDSQSIQFSTTDTMQFAVDMDTRQVWFGKNNTWYNAGSGTDGNPSAGTGYLATLSSDYDYAPSYAGETTGKTANVNFGQQPFAYTPPTGFKALSTQNLPDATVIPSESFGVGLWTGNGSASGPSVTNLNFKPELLWSKSRSISANHYLYDIVRSPGDSPNKFIGSNTTDAEQTFDAFTLTDTGFNLATDNVYFNQSDQTYVAWNWKAGGTAVTNNDGTIESQVSANPEAGCSVVTYTGTGSNATVGHGLDTTPKVLIGKNRTFGVNWRVYHESLGATKFLNLNLNNAATTSILPWNNTAPTSSVFSIGTSDNINRIDDNIVMYCFAEVEGYSKFGTYQGNSLVNGPFVYTGFKPAFVLIKNVTQASDWMMFDNTRNPYNATNLYLQPNAASGDAPGIGDGMDLVSNGFKLRSSNLTVNGNTHIYMAFAEQPFKNANAR